MKSNWTMYRIARALALANGPVTIRDSKGNSACGYALSREDLAVMYARNGFNIRSVTWLNNISSWRMFGDYVPDEKIIKESKDWWVIFALTPDIKGWEERQFQLIGYMAKHDISKVIS